MAVQIQDDNLFPGRNPQPRPDEPWPIRGVRTYFGGETCKFFGILASNESVVLMTNHDDVNRKQPCFIEQNAPIPGHFMPRKSCPWRHR